MRRQPARAPAPPRPMARVKEELADELGLGSGRWGSEAGGRRAVPPAPAIARPRRSLPQRVSAVLPGSSRPRELIVIDDDDDDEEGDAVLAGSGGRLQEIMLDAGRLEVDGGRRGMRGRLGDPGGKLVDVGVRRCRAAVETSNYKKRRRPGSGDTRSVGGRVTRPGSSSGEEEVQAVAEHNDEHQQEEAEEEEEDGEEEEEEDGEEEESRGGTEHDVGEEDGSMEVDDNSHPQQDSDGTFEEVDTEETEYEDDDEQFNEADEDQQHSTSNDAMAGRNFRSVDEGKQIFRKKLFEGLSLTKQVDNTVGDGIGARTRSNFRERKCLDKKLLTRGIYSKPYCIDVSESSSESEQDMPAPAQELPSPSNEWYEDNDYSDDGTTRKRRGRWRRECYARSDGSEEEETLVRKFRKGSGSERANKQPPYRQTAKEACDDYSGNPQYAKNRGPNAGSDPTDRGCAKDDIVFKKNALAPRKKGGRTAADRRIYNDLIDSIFHDLEKYRNGPVCAQVLSENRLPLVFSFEDEDEVENKSENDKFLNDLWREFDFALEANNICSQSCKEGEMSNSQEIPGDKATTCNKGKHDFIVDEQIGVRCKYCDFIDIEIRHVLPSMDKFSMERDTKLNPKLDLMIDGMLTSMGCEGTHSFGGHRTGMVWDLVSWEDMFPHQKEGFEFMWKKLAGGVSIEQMKYTLTTDVEGGCVISHAPGTGKTRLAITFLQSYLELFPQCAPVIIAPKGMLATWEQEFKKWNVKLPFHVLNSSEIHWKEDRSIQKMVAKNEISAQKLFKNILSQQSKRAVKLKSWNEGSSIIGVSYSLFRKLAKDDGMDGQVVRELLLERPELLVLDEGHTPRNNRSLIWKVLAEVRTGKRIILSGTPFQNNFIELYNILCLVNPRFARDFASKRRGQSGPAPHIDSNQDLGKHEGKDFWASLKLNDTTDEDIDEIKKILAPFVHIHNGDILRRNLPGLMEAVVIINPLPCQKKIITRIERVAAKGTLDAEYKISLASVHPSLIKCTNLSEQEASIVDVFLPGNLRLDPHEGVKTWFVLEMVRLCNARKERVLVFSQYLEPLSLLMEQLARSFSWTEGTEILLMSGSVLAKNRQAMMEAFNDMNSEAKVMLASTKACCEGITLVGASRVVLLDVVWNPSVGRQAIGRAYRIGQEKPVYTYNLIAEGTKEKLKFDTQAKKEDMSKKLFSNGARSTGSNLPSKLQPDDEILDVMNERLKNLFVQILPSHWQPKPNCQTRVTGKWQFLRCIFIGHTYKRNMFKLLPNAAGLHCKFSRTHI